ncbi:hypothetical protein [Mesorhizobium jarvisii]|uniref:hypothetical protein n=1 Tax=Mesorhizobium jarvisii TaxID=1777867 RepID=UPI001F0A41E8|nr:hypothetical protein [Mesorhizobium jarvisii]MCH4561068.1 hypothetical protein [Mesorhizobium jarvisii]
MGISFDNDMRIAGYRPAIFKEALRGFMRTGMPGNLIDLRSVFPLRRDGAIVFEECLDRRLIGADRLTVTESGEAIAYARAKRRTPIAKAQTLLNEFLRSVEALNRDPKAVTYVDEVWLFGSVMRGQESVGDIDLALKTTRRPEFAGRYDLMQDHLDDLLSAYPDAPRHWQMNWLKESWVTNRALYGPRRHPLLAGVHDGVSDLISLGVPCRLIYDRERGGEVDEPIQPWHPDSSGRRDGLGQPAEMPDFTPNLIRPMDARWIAGFSAAGMLSPYDIFRGWTDEAYRMFPEHPKGLRIAADDFCPHGDFWKPKRLEMKGLDGRNSIALINAMNRWGTSIVLNRSIETCSTAWTLHASFTDLELYRSRTRLELVSLPDIAAAASLILAVDAERMLRRGAEIHGAPAARIQVTSDTARDGLQEHLIEPVREILNSRAIRIEPLDWRGSQVEVL